MEKIIDDGSKRHFVISSIKGAIVGLCVAMVLILAFAFVVKWTSIGENVINPINQLIKIISIFFAVLSSCKNSTYKYFAKGLFVGALFSALAYLLFSMLNNFNFTFEMSLIWDILFGTLIGGLCSVAVRYIKK